MHCRLSLLRRPVLTAWNDAGWKALEQSQAKPTSLVGPLRASVASSCSPPSCRLIHAQRRSHPAAHSRTRTRHRSPINSSSPTESSKDAAPTYTAYDPSIHTAATHPPLRLLYGSFAANSSYAVIYKPPNLSVAAYPPRDSVERRLREGWTGVASRQRVWFPHRLDKHTEGVMVVAFDGALNSRMGREIAEQRWTKRYRLIGRLPHGLPAVEVAADEEGDEKQEEKATADARHAEGKEEKDRQALERRLSKLCCSHLDGSLFTSRGLLPSGVLSCNLARRPPPAPAVTVDYEAEEQRWLTNSHVPTAYTAPSTSTHASKRHRRIHPFVPETMLYYSVPADSPIASRKAHSQYRLLDVDAQGRQAMWEAELLTGRSHQLRVHWSDAGCPIVNDPYYDQQYVWEQVQAEKARRARLVAGNKSIEQVGARGDEQLNDGMDKFVVLVQRERERPQQPIEVQEDEEEKADEQEQAAERDQLSRSSAADRSATTRSTSPPASSPRPSVTRVTPLGPSYRILPPASSRAFSTQQWQSVLDKYGVKSATEGRSRRRVKAERGVVDDVESMAELREAEEEESIRLMIEAKRQRKEERKNRHHLQQQQQQKQNVEELDMDDVLAIEQDEVELYPAAAPTTTVRPRPPTLTTRSPTSTAHASPPHRPTATATSASVDNPLASAGWLAMASPTIRSPFATASHGMRLQSYYMSIPHPTRPGDELTVVMPLPPHWTTERDGQQTRWARAETEWTQWQVRAKRKSSMGRLTGRIGKPRERTRGEDRMR